MKKRYFIIAVLIVILPLIGCDKFKKPAIPPEAITEIYALTEAPEVAKYVEVKDVQDRKDFCYIMIYIKSLPEQPTTLESALEQSKKFTKEFVESTVKILKKYNINQDISVWAQLPLKDQEVSVLGHARYDAKHSKYYDFERYVPAPAK
jgi:hypothetical protein